MQPQNTISTTRISQVRMDKFNPVTSMQPLNTYSTTRPHS
jgi:hypothetical protein